MSIIFWILVVIAGWQAFVWLVTEGSAWVARPRGLGDTGGEIIHTLDLIALVLALGFIGLLLK